jgi:hypothetical protein
VSAAEQIADFDSLAHATSWAFLLSVAGVCDSQESTWRNPRRAPLGSLTDQRASIIMITYKATLSAASPLADEDRSTF